VRYVTSSGFRRQLRGQEQVTRRPRKAGGVDGTVAASLRCLADRAERPPEKRRIIVYGCVRDVDVLAFKPRLGSGVASHPMKTNKRGGIAISTSPSGFRRVTSGRASFVYYADNNGIIVSLSATMPAWDTCNYNVTCASAGDISPASVRPKQGNGLPLRDDGRTQLKRCAS